MAVTSSSANDLPSIEEELNRKTLDTLMDMLMRHEREEISDRELSVALDAIFGVTSGLVDRSIFALITKASEERCADTDPSVVLIRPTGQLVRLVDLPHGVSVLIHDDGKWRESTVLSGTTLKEVADRLKTKGAIQISH